MTKTTPINPNGIAYAASSTNINARQVMAVLNLAVVEECTVPFISRYRKEHTGGLDEVQIRNICDSYNEHLEIEKRRDYIIETITKMEKMTPELEKKIKTASTLNQLEDIYAPYKSKKKTKATIAKEAGLEPLAKLLLTSPMSLEEIKTKHASEFVGKSDKITTFEDAVKGACDILIEDFAHDTEIKEELRQTYWKSGKIVSEKKSDAESIKEFDKFKDFFEFSEPIEALKNPKSSHRYLAMRRGMTLKVLKVEVEKITETALSLLQDNYFPKDKKIGNRDLVEKCAVRAYEYAIHPSLDLEIKTELKKIADAAAIDVFGVNLKNLLLQPYLGSKAVLGVDPGIRTGCKIVIIDATGKFVGDFVIYPHEPRCDVSGSAILISKAIELHNIEYVAIGNGTASRETLAFFENNIDVIKSGKVKATTISEAGASVYSASDIAREEFPDKDVTVRGSISIARRFQDPLAELVKIDPKSIGVGQYQHDVNQARLKKSLEAVTENCVNYVGVNLNTASAPLLSYVSGIGSTLAKNIVSFREKIKGFKNRKQLLEVPRFSDKVFEQSAGFLRIYDGQNPLDATFIHPERYPVIADWVKKKNKFIKDLVGNTDLIAELKKDNSLKDSIGQMTFEDIVKALEAPSQDPRTTFKSVEFHKDLRTLEDVKVGSWYTGVVNNITNFGAFVDIGIKESGLVHVSQMSDNFVENALEEFKVGQQVKVKVIEVDLARKRISLSCKSDAQVQTSTTPSTSAGRSGDKRPAAGGKNIPRPQQQGNRSGKSSEIKNNPFAALSGLKLK